MAHHTHYQTINPATGKEGKTYPLVSDEELFHRLDVASKAFEEDWKARSPAERGQVVGRAADILRDKKDHYAGLITLEIGKLTAQAYYEVDISASILDYYANHAEAFLKPKPVPEADDCEMFIEPIGALLAIEPWNFPYYQVARVAGPHLTAGNVVLAKHAPSVPQCALAFEQLFREAGGPKGIWTNLFCDNDQIAKLIKDPRIKALTLTGSERAGASVAEQAGRELKKVVLELGGSDPFIILPDADLDNAIRRATDARLTNMGQACIGSKRFIVVGKECGEKVLQGMKAIFEDLKVGDPSDKSVTLGALVNEKILGGLLKQVEDAQKAGARIFTGGKRLDRPGCYLAPTIITDISKPNPLFNQEAFGPVASFYIVDSEEEAIALANATTFGLGSSVFSSDIEHARKVAMKIDSGMVFISSGGYSTPQVPFGGVKNSGFGRELSELGVHEFVNWKIVRVHK